MDVKSNARPKLQLEIQSDTVRRGFALIAQNMTTIRLSHDPIIIPEPFMEVYHCRGKIQQALKAEESNILRAELQLLVDFQDQYMKETIKTIGQFISNGYIEFEWLWAIFPPGELVVIENVSASDAPIQWCAIVKAFEYKTLDSGAQVWSLTVIHTGFNGLRLGKTETKLAFPAFSNNIGISRLPAYPLKFCKDEIWVQQEAIRRGRSYDTYCLASSRSKESPVGTPMWHAGSIWTERERDDRRGCRIMDNPSGTRSNTATSITQLGASFTLSSLSEDELLTCPPLVPAYSFTSRQWCFVFIDDLCKIVWKPQIFEQLQIDEEMKGALQGLVHGYSTHAVLFDDFIEGKGRGLVFLLHGPPGCGKTMTAESISESLEKPLYHVSGGELGASVESIQDTLEIAFERATRWDTILLLDEADAFLARRDGADIERNSLIAVFLRLLEYQSGIVFLTTNGPSDFDPAFESRIHLQISFSRLDASKRELIWKLLAQKNGGCNLSPEQSKALGKLPLNGRRIKNILRLASLFAANRIQDSSKANGDAGDLLVNNKETDVVMEFGDIKKVLPFAITRLENAKRAQEEYKETEDLPAALADLMAEFSLKRDGPV
ncbi:AAA domain-containing protein [Fusarium sp. LHS14.1]|nr:AAA domain-containing protein [Fusarium sp. LHS14.1]